MSCKKRNERDRVTEREWAHRTTRCTTHRTSLHTQHITNYTPNYTSNHIPISQHHSLIFYIKETKLVILSGYFFLSNTTHKIYLIYHLKLNIISVPIIKNIVRFRGAIHLTYIHSVRSVRYASFSDLLYANYCQCTVTCIRDNSPCFIALPTCFPSIPLGKTCL